VVYLNVPIDEMKVLTAKVLIDKKIPVWMGCDVGKQFSRPQGIWDASLFDYGSLYGISNAFTFGTGESLQGMSKKERLLHGATLMTHAMLFTGCDVPPEATEGNKYSKVRKWRVENSWGADKCGEKGFCAMNDSWFDEHMFEIAVPKDLLTDDMLRALDTTPVVLPAWDPMGSLARQEGKEI
jgi:bleomycin hydrolase